ncbi:MAG: hypothetical protein MJ153_07635 [Clostridia bacterium]|nr:hypothetical protein [Clostridia bacterium]
MTDKKYGKRLYYIAVFFASLIIGAVRLIYIKDLNGLVVFEDELGYWTHAANFNGLNWSNTLNMWYSFGYSLILAPIFKITHDMALMYKIGVGINALLGVIGFLAGLKLIDKLTDRILPDFAKLFISFTPMMYSAYLLQNNICWSETFLYTWVILTCLAVCTMFENPNVLNSFLAAFTVSFSFVIHNRVLVLLIAFALTLIVFMLRRKLPLKSFLVIIATVGLVFYWYTYVKTMLKTVEYNPAYILKYNTFGIGDSQNAAYSASDFAGNNLNQVMSHLDGIFTLTKIKSLIKSLLGALWYLDVGSLGLSFLGICQLIIFTYRKIKSKKDFEGSIFLTLVFLGTVGLSSLTLIAPETTKNFDRLDCYFYGRYEDQISTFLIMLGLLFIYETIHNVVIRKKNYWRYAFLALCMVIHLGSSFIVGRQIRSIPVPVTRCVRVCAAALFYKDNYDYSFYSTIGIAAYAFLFILFIVFALIFKKIKINDKASIAVIAVVSVIFSLWSLQITYYNFKDDTLANQERWDTVIPAAEVVTSDSDATVFFYAGCDYYYLRTLRTKCVDNLFMVGIPDNLSFLEGINHAYFVIPNGIPEEYFPAGQIEFLKDNCSLVVDDNLQHSIYEYSRNTVRSFVVNPDNISFDLTGDDVIVTEIQENYINFSPDVSIRSVDGGNFSVITTVDPHNNGMVRYITEPEYEHFLTKSEGIAISITRYQFIDDNGNPIILDYYHDSLDGLVCMSIEFADPEAALAFDYEALDCVLAEITNDYNYKSGFLARFGIPEIIDETAVDAETGNVVEAVPA